MGLDVSLTWWDPYERGSLDLTIMFFSVQEKLVTNLANNEVATCGHLRTCQQVLNDPCPASHNCDHIVHNPA